MTKLTDKSKEAEVIRQSRRAIADRLKAEQHNQINDEEKPERAEIKGALWPEA